jgi:hydrogenase maturation factor
MCLGSIGVVEQVGESGGMPTATVDLGSRRIEAPLLVGVVPDRGDHVVVHSGFVVEVLDADTAAEMLAARRELAEFG